MSARLAWRKQSRSEALSFRQSTSTSTISGYGQTHKGSSELSRRDDIRLNSTECSQTSPRFRNLLFLLVVSSSSKETLMGLQTYMPKPTCILAQACSDNWSRSTIKTEHYRQKKEVNEPGGRGVVTRVFIKNNTPSLKSDSNDVVFSFFNSYKQHIIIFLLSCLYRVGPQCEREKQKQAKEAIFNHHQNLLQVSIDHRLLLLHGGLLIWKLLHKRLRRSLLGLDLDLFSIYLHSVLAVVSPAQTRNLLQDLFADIASSRSRPTCQSKEEEDGPLCFFDVLADYYVNVSERGKDILDLMVQLWSQSFASHIFSLLFHKWVLRAIIARDIIQGSVYKRIFAE
ncbi:unnamed protein product [Brassica napus]|uniref:(rape) hypothetical protein n=1 Tax=Brassica napus TaxID=3708 RepID=A0A816I124_BRANA|nr:unnamed protein product [Brassica napus]